MIPANRKPANNVSHLSDVNIPSTAKNAATRKAIQYINFINILVYLLDSVRYYLTPENKDQILFVKAIKRSQIVKSKIIESLDRHFIKRLCVFCFFDVLFRT